MKDDAQPKIHPPRKVPLSLIPKLKETLARLEKTGVISKSDKPSDWVNSLVIVEKKDGSLRLCLDPKDLNKAIKREYFKPPSIETISSKLSGKKVFTVIDMTNCYWHKKLDEKSSELCTFNTPFGRYKFNRMPFGICSASDIAQKMVENHFGNIDGVLAVHDDITISGKNTEEHDIILRQVLNRATESNIKFNRSKIQLRVKEVTYLGGIVSADGFKPDPMKVKAITNMPRPENKQALQRLLGMVNYLSSFIPNLSEITAPLRALLKKDVRWVWYHEHDQSLEKLKKCLTSKPVLKFYDVNKPTTLQVDASQHGLGAYILQVAYASRSLTTAETHYAQIEKELLAIVFGCERFHCYTYGVTIDVQSDHKPLEQIMKKPLSQVPPRIQRLFLRLQKYQLSVRYVPGKYLYIADTLSRAFLQEPDDQSTSELHQDSEVMIHSLLSNLPVSDEKLIQLKEATSTDEILQILANTIKSGWPNNKRDISKEIVQY